MFLSFLIPSEYFGSQLSRYPRRIQKSESCIFPASNLLFRSEYSLTCHRLLMFACCGELLILSEAPNLGFLLWCDYCWDLVNFEFSALVGIWSSFYGNAGAVRHFLASIAITAFLLLPETEIRIKLHCWMYYKSIRRDKGRVSSQHLDGAPNPSVAGLAYFVFQVQGMVKDGTGNKIHQDRHDCWSMIGNGSYLLLGAVHRSVPNMTMLDLNCYLNKQISDVSSDLTIEVGSTNFSLHKLLLEAKDTKVSRINLTGLHGGSDAFELTAKFCYGVNVEITISNVALLRCATSQLTNAIANNACKEQLTSGLSRVEYNFLPKPAQCVDSETPSDWWGKSLAVLNLNFFQRVLSAVKTKGLKQDIISRVLINYAQNSLQGLLIKDLPLVKESFLNLDLQKRQRIIVETIAGLLPTQSRKSTVPMAFLSSLLKSAIVASASTSAGLI
ncbi:putative zinc finger CCCH domain-containing protein 32-like [Capsicum annuum]|nr:putative zinc finger CCCH domain-containing protein 32-like [Capsicum annuum]KAF3676495.1 putative zinc finger CCCH domain-containing protein 32-like [Capsicum annuum]